MWFGGDLPDVPFGRGARVRVFGSMWMMAAFCAAALATISDARSQQRALFWFLIGHTVVWLAVLSQVSSVFGPGIGELVVTILRTTSFLLLYFWVAAEGLFRPAPVEAMRSRYEREIRQAAAQEERNRLARDLHDAIKQQIFAIQTAAATAQTRFSSDPSGAKEALNQIRSSAREAMTEMEVMLDQLKAEPLESVGLVEALKKLCESIGFRTGCKVEFAARSMQTAGMLSPGAAEAVLRVAQEALANVARHARASRVVVTLGAAGDGIELTVSDDGAGFDASRVSSGMGTTNMRMRAEEFGGKLELSSSPDAGTRVRFFIPNTTATSTGGLSRVVAVGLPVLAIVMSQVGSQSSVVLTGVCLIGLAVFQYRTVWGTQDRSETAR